MPVLNTNGYLLHYRLKTWVLECHEQSSRGLSQMTKYLRTSCSLFCVYRLFLLYFDMSIISCSRQYLLPIKLNQWKQISTFIVSKADPQSNLFNNMRFVVFFFLSGFMSHVSRCSYLQRSLANDLTYPAFSYVLMVQVEKPYSPLLSPALLQYF